MLFLSWILFCFHDFEVRILFKKWLFHSMNLKKKVESSKSSIVVGGGGVEGRWECEREAATLLSMYRSA